jgi:hypothetical protein
VKAFFQAIPKISIRSRNGTGLANYRARTEKDALSQYRKATVVMTANDSGDIALLNRVGLAFFSLIMSAGACKGAEAWFNRAAYQAA